MPGNLHDAGDTEIINRAHGASHSDGRRHEWRIQRGEWVVDRHGGDRRGSLPGGGGPELNLRGLCCGLPVGGLLRAAEVTPRGRWGVLESTCRSRPACGSQCQLSGHQSC